MVFNGTRNSDSMDYEWDIHSGFIKHGWKISELNGGLNGKIAYKWSIFQHAMFDCRRVTETCKMDGLGNSE